MHKHILIQYLAPLAALGVLAFGSAAAAESGVSVASARLPRHAAAASAPVQKPQAPADDDVPDEDFGTVLGAAVHIRSGPGTQFSVVATLKHGDEVKIEAKQPGWLKIEWPDYAGLWIGKETVHLHGTGAEREATLRIATGLRSTASNKAEPVSKLEPGTKLTVLEEHNGWLKVKAPTTLHAFISARYVSNGAAKTETANKESAAHIAAASSIAHAPRETAKRRSASMGIERKPAVVETARTTPVPAPVIQAPAPAPAARVPAPMPETAARLGAGATPHVQPGAIDEDKPSKPMPVTLSARAALPEPLSSSQPAARRAPKAAPRIQKNEAPEILIAEPPKKSVYLPPPGPAADFSEAPVPAGPPAPPTPAAPAAVSEAPAVASAAVPTPAQKEPARAISPEPVVTTVSAASALHSGSGAVRLNDRSFNGVVGNKGLALVDFNATWCGPCRRMSPVVEGLADEMGGEIAVGKLDVDESPMTAGKFGVRAIPCLILFKDGREVERHTGLQSADEVRDWLRQYR